jgi:hypothetical protein
MNSSPGNEEVETSLAMGTQGDSSVQIVKTITAGLAHGAQHPFPWILPHQAQQLRQEKREHIAASLFQAPTTYSANSGAAVTMPCSSGCGPGGASPGGSLDVVLGLTHLSAAADPLHRDRVAVAVQCQIPFDMDQPVLQPVDFRNPRRQRLQMQPLDGKQLAAINVSTTSTAWRRR